MASSLQGEFVSESLPISLPVSSESSQSSESSWPEGSSEGTGGDQSAPGANKQVVRHEVVKADPSRYIEIHAVRCTHNDFLFEDVPKPVIHQTGSGPAEHLTGLMPITSVREFLESRPGRAFLVVFYHLCGHSYNTSPRHKLGEIMPVSPSLHKTFKRVTKYRRSSMDPPFLRPPVSIGSHAPVSIGSNPNGEPQLYSKTFLYHHRETLDDNGGRGKRRDEMDALLRYLALAPVFGSQFDLCDREFASRSVSRDTLDYLFRPHETLVISSVDSAGEVHHSAVMLGKVSKDLESGELKLVCWQWAYCSVELCRRMKVLTVAATRDGGPMADLPAYPWKYASDEIKQELAIRGQKFWDLVRRPVQVEYSGWDANRGALHVRLPPLHNMEVHQLNGQR